MVTVTVNLGPNSAEVTRTCLSKRKRTVEGFFDVLPSEILLDIALMLPLSSIKNMKCSSKFWYNFLTYTEFVNLHFTRALQKPPGYLFDVLYDKSSRMELACYFVEQSGGNISTSCIFEDLKERFIDLRCLSSGGLMCVYITQSNCFRVFNPDIGEEVKVSGVPQVKNRYDLESWFFGYSPSTKEYKILEIGKLYDTPETRFFRSIEDLWSSSTVGAITTLGSSIWRDIHVPPNICLNSATECQGSLYWTHESNVVTFDLVSEKFHELPGPPREFAKFSMSETLVSMSHTIGYVMNNRLWVLEDKIKGIWINRYDFSVSPLNKFQHRFTGISDNGGLFGHVRDSLDVFIHDLGCTGFRVMKIDLDERGDREAPKWIRYIAPHVRSLVSPVSIMENGRKSNVKVLDSLKSDDDSTEDDHFDSICMKV